MKNVTNSSRDISPSRLESIISISSSISVWDISCWCHSEGLWKRVWLQQFRHGFWVRVQWNEYGPYFMGNGSQDTSGGITLAPVGKEHHRHSRHFYRTILDIFCFFLLVFDFSWLFVTFSEFKRSNFVQ